jgi:signal transduction histidine kinase
MWPNTAKPKSVNICLEKYRRTIRLTVRDNGRGFDPAHLERPKTALRGVGLNSMRERTEAPGGLFKIESAKGSGTTIQSSWPMKRGGADGLNWMVECLLWIQKPGWRNW